MAAWPRWPGGLGRPNGELPHAHHCANLERRTGGPAAGRFGCCVCARAARFPERNPSASATLAPIQGCTNSDTTLRYLHPNARQPQQQVAAL